MCPCTITGYRVGRQICERKREQKEGTKDVPTCKCTSCCKKGFWRSCESKPLGSDELNNFSWRFLTKNMLMTLRGEKNPPKYVKASRLKSQVISPLPVLKCHKWQMQVAAWESGDDGVNSSPASLSLAGEFFKTINSEGRNQVAQWNLSAKEFSPRWARQTWISSDWWKNVLYVT